MQCREPKQSAMERGESSISIGPPVAFGTSSTQNVPIFGGFGKDDPEIGKSDGRTDPDAGGIDSD